MKYPFVALMIGLSAGLGIFMPSMADAALAGDYEHFIEEADANQD